jgi:PTS system nitrogen regulatory IIA component
MNQIANLLPLANVVADLDASSKKRVFEQVGILFENHQTGLGQGIAIPHGRIKGLKTPIGAFCRLVTPVQFDAPDGKPVGLIFVLLVPEAANEHHLQLLSELAQMFSDKAFRDQLGAAPDAAALHGLFANWHAS